MSKMVGQNGAEFSLYEWFDWFGEVNVEIESNIPGCSYKDLPPFAYQEYFEAGESAEDTAIAAIGAAGIEIDDDEEE